MGDLDILVTGEACTSAEGRQKAIAYVAQYPPLMDVIASGDNKISFHVRSGMQIEVRLLTSPTRQIETVPEPGSASVRPQPVEARSQWWHRKKAARMDPRPERLRVLPV